MTSSTGIGLDVHARSISATELVYKTGELVRASFGYDPTSVAEWAQAQHRPARAACESGPNGFDPRRSLDSLGLPGAVGAVSKMLRPSGDRVKTDRRDDDFLARMLAVGNVVECWCPTTSQEADRDLSRPGEQAGEDLMRARHQLSKRPGATTATTSYAPARWGGTTRACWTPTASYGGTRSRSAAAEKLEARPAFVWTTPGTGAHFLARYVALTMLRLLQRATGVPAARVREEVAAMSCSAPGASWRLFDHRTDESDAILEAAGMPELRRRNMGAAEIRAAFAKAGRAGIPRRKDSSA